jgi:hypothetical protein
VACGGGRFSGGLRVWKVLEIELNPVFGSIIVVELPVLVLFSSSM